MCVLPAESRMKIENGSGSIQTAIAPWANVIFLHDTRAALEVIWQWFEKFGLAREEGDVDPLTDWSRVDKPNQRTVSTRLRMAGRFGQWKYFWSDDCVLRGRQLGIEARKFELA